ncbi:hypothetical protein NECAME_10741 [Necator americanus]|uniref:Uncharacterized protein n=1 Tax=Necator americanus TaxID=51031 RepID=W2T9H8_NECAM|nr:hypothetical protein NECAME_10741 [Necator americanus]ETN77841.1 hypothetical protein NECAME_10741 [Necator americanus]
MRRAKINTDKVDGEQVKMSNNKQFASKKYFLRAGDLCRSIVNEGPKTVIAQCASNKISVACQFNAVARAAWNLSLSQMFITRRHTDASLARGQPDVIEEKNNVKQLVELNLW